MNTDKAGNCGVKKRRAPVGFLPLYVYINRKHCTNTLKMKWAVDQQTFSSCTLCTHNSGYKEVKTRVGDCAGCCTARRVRRHARIHRTLNTHTHIYHSTKVRMQLRRGQGVRTLLRAHERSVPMLCNAATLIAVAGACGGVRDVHRNDSVHMSHTTASQHGVKCMAQQFIWAAGDLPGRSKHTAAPTHMYM